MKQNGSHRPIRTLFIPPSSDLLRQPGRIILKDGTAAELREERSERERVERRSPYRRGGAGSFD